jgi:thioesterase domain-containing protein
VGEIDNKKELNGRLSALSPAQRAWLEQRLQKSAGDRPIGKRRPAVIELQAGGDKLPMYFIYAGPDEIQLAQMMGAERSIFGIDVPWPLSWRDAVTNNEIAALPTMDQLVAPYVDALSAHLGSSPCVLAGHCFAGLIAFEMAHQLRRRGAEVKMVILMDSPAGFLRPHQIAWHKLREDWRGTSNGLETNRSSRSIKSFLSQLWQTSWWLLLMEANAVRSVFNPSRSAFNPATPTDLGAGLTALVDEEGMPLDWSMVEQLYMRAMMSCRRRSLNSRGILFRTEPEGERRVFGFYPRLVYRSLGWENLFTKGLEIIPMTGDHLTMIREEPHRLFLAQKMKEVLKRYETN